VTVAVIGTLMIVLMACVAFRFACALIWNAEFEQMSAISAEVLQRGESSSHQIQAAIDDLQRLGPSSPCSSRQVALMAQINLKYGQLQGVGYVANDRLMCSSYGRHGEGISLPSPTWQTAKGGSYLVRKVNLSLSGSEGSQPVIVVTAASSGYSAIVLPTLPIDVYTKDHNIVLGTVFYGSNQIRIARGMFDPAWRARLGDAGHAEFVEHDRIVALWRSPKYDYFAFAAIPADAASARVRHAGALIASCAGFAMAVLMCATVWLARKQVSIAESIREALRRREFHLVYQPTVDLETGRWVGAEALLRWRRSTGEYVRPDLFIPAAEESNLIEEITNHVLELAAAELSGFFRRHPNFHVAINLSSSEMQSAELVSRLKHFVARITGARAHNFVFEATERGLLNPEKAREVFRQVRALGSSVAIDDFGTGYSSLSYLQTLGADYLKIDKSFVDAIDTVSVKNHVVAHIIGLARDLQLRMVAEGVETAEQADYLRGRGVEYAQGWHFARPMRFDELCSSLEGQAA